MGWLSLISGLVKLAGKLAGWLDDRQKIESGKARAVRDALNETLEIIEYAKRVDVDTADLSPDARRRVRDAIKRTVRDNVQGR